LPREPHIPRRHDRCVPASLQHLALCFSSAEQVETREGRIDRSIEKILDDTGLRDR
jgi:hypothetical protein